MIRYAIFVWTVLLIVLLTSGCGLPRWGTDTVPSQFSLDGVKRISPGLATDDPNTWSQSTYLVSTQSHVLLRFESLDAHTSRISTSGTNKVELQITLADESEMGTALASLNLCPVTRSWMMLATWELAHPFMGGDPWTTAGADYEAAGCVLGTLVTGSTKSIVYDVTQWFNDYPKGRATNYGLIAISTQPINIVGDHSGSFSPRIAFQEF